MSSGASFTPSEVGGAQLGLGILGGLTGALGAIGQYNAAKDAGQRAQEAAEANAQILEELGAQAASEERRGTIRLVAAQRAAFAANGVNPGTGSALDVLFSSAFEGEVSAQRARYGFDSQAYQERINGILANFSAETAAGSILSQGLGQGANTILGASAAGLRTLQESPTPTGAGASGRVKVPKSGFATSRTETT